MVEDIFVLTCVMGMIYSKGNNRSSLKVIIVIKDQENEELVWEFMNKLNLMKLKLQIRCKDVYM